MKIKDKFEEKSLLKKRLIVLRKLIAKKRPIDSLFVSDTANLISDDHEGYVFEDKYVSRGQITNLLNDIHRLKNLTSLEQDLIFRAALNTRLSDNEVSYLRDIVNGDLLSRRIDENNKVWKRVNLIILTVIFTILEVFIDSNFISLAIIVLVILLILEFKEFKTLDSV